jgi:hypothetical protein
MLPMFKEKNGMNSKWKRKRHERKVSLQQREPFVSPVKIPEKKIE